MLRSPLICAAFAVSGAAALIYQIVWQRMLTLVSGSDTLSVTIIVAAFLAGLGIGHLLGGPLADRLGARRALAALAGCEAGVAAFAAASVALFHEMLHGASGLATLPLPAMAALSFVAVLWPTCLMGMTLPLAVVGCASGTGDPVPLQTAGHAASLYGWNALGAAAGAFASMVLLPLDASLQTLLLLGVALNLTCAAAMLVARRGATRTARGAVPAASAGVRGHDLSASAWRAWLAVFALSGFVALSLELVWFRLLGVVLKSHSLTFAWLLGCYISGIGLGALAGRWLARRIATPARAFLICQAVIPIYAALAVTVLVAGLEHVPWLEPIRAYLAGGDPIRPGQGMRLWLVLHAALPLGLIGPPTVLMGVSFALLQAAVQRDPALAGRRVGWLQAANIAGSVAGALATGLWLLDVGGVTGTLQALAAGSVSLLLLAGLRVADPPPRAWRAAVAGLVAVAGVVWLVPAGAVMWPVLHGARGALIVEERASGVSTLILQEEGTQVFSNGLSQSTLPYGATHTLLGLLPALLHESPRRVAVIGLGSGDTLFAVGARAGTARIESLEIMAGQLDALRAFSLATPYPALSRLLGDGRIRHQVTDGRAFLKRSTERFDIIEADAMRPDGPHAGALYSLEYFELLRARLNPGGLAATWLPTTRVLATMLRVFPYVLVAGEVGIGSDRPFPADRAVLTAGLNRPDVRSYFDGSGVDLESAVAEARAGTWVVFDPSFDRSPLTDVNRDLTPRDEFRIAQTSYLGLPVPDAAR